MGAAVLIGQQRLGEKHSNIQLSTPIDITPFHSSLFSSPTLTPLFASSFSAGRVGEGGGGEQINGQVCVIGS